MGKYLSTGMSRTSEIAFIGDEVKFIGRSPITPVIARGRNDREMILTLASPCDIGHSYDPDDYDSFCDYLEIPSGSKKKLAEQFRKMADWLEQQ